jgi:hypothetical protein
MWSESPEMGTVWTDRAATPYKHPYHSSPVWPSGVAEADTSHDS